MKVWLAYRPLLLWDKINNERQVLAQPGLSPAVQSARIVRHMLARGITHCRTHVDIGPDIGLKHFHGVMAMRQAHRDWMDLQVVAFPQTGVMVRPGTLSLLEQAVREGAEVPGGLDPMGIDHDPKGQLDGLFAIAGRHGCELDIHLHDPGALGCRHGGDDCPAHPGAGPERAGAQPATPAPCGSRHVRCRPARTATPAPPTSPCPAGCAYAPRAFVPQAVGQLQIVG